MHPQTIKLRTNLAPPPPAHVGSVLRLKVNTTSAMFVPKGLPAMEGNLVTVELAHLRSYENMGMAEVKCEVSLELGLEGLCYGSESVPSR